MKALGFGGRRARKDGSITAGAILLDSEFDRIGRQAPAAANARAGPRPRLQSRVPADVDHESQRTLCISLPRLRGQALAAMASFLQPLLREGAGRQHIVNTRSGKIVASQLLTAFDSESRRKGLLAHASLPPSTAMIIAPSNAIHTFFMKFPIDIAFVAKSGRILKIRSSVPAWRMTASFRAFAVTRTGGGIARRFGYEGRR